MLEKTDRLREIEDKIPLVINIADIIGVPGARVFAVCENLNIGGSHKARPIARMLRCAIEDGRLRDGMRPAAYSVGSTGKALACICRDVFEKVRPIVVLPTGTTREREDAIISYGAELILADGDRVVTENDIKQGVSAWIRSAVAIVVGMAAEDSNIFPVEQSDNVDSKDAFHGLGTYIASCKPDYVISAAGTGSTIIGIGEMCRIHSPTTKMIATEPIASPRVSTFKNGTEYKHTPHMMFGTGPGGEPTSILRAGIGNIDCVITVDDKEAYYEAGQLAQEFRKSGAIELAPGPTSAANVIAARKILSSHPNATIFLLFHDLASMYESRGIVVR